MKKLYFGLLLLLSIVKQGSTWANVPVVHSSKLPAFTVGDESIRELWGLYNRKGYPSTDPKHSVALVDIVPLGSSKNHVHSEVEETYFVLGGSGEVTLKNERGQYFKTILNKGELLSIPPKTEHFVKNISASETLELFVVAAGPWHPTCMTYVDFIPVERAPNISAARKGTPFETHGVKVWELWGNTNKHSYEITPKHSVAVIEIATNSTSVEHHHNLFEETYYVTSGKGFLTLNGEKVEIVAGDLVYIPINARHSLSNEADTILELLAVAAGPWSLEGTVF